MKSKNILGLALSLCLGLGAFSSCTPNTQVGSTPTGVQPNQISTQTANLNSSQTASLQAALANYHEVDASFADTARIAKAGQFQTKLLGDLLGDDDEDDHDNGGLLDDVLGNDDHGSSNGSSNGSSSTDLNVGLNANANANLDSDSHDSSHSGSNSSTDLNVGLNANASANLDSDSQGSHSGTSGTGSTGSTSTGSHSGSSSDTSLGLDLNADAMLSLFDDSDFDEDRLEADLRANLSLDSNVDSDDGDDSGRVWTQISADALARLSSRNFNNNSWSSSGNDFMARYANGSSQRNVKMTADSQNQASYSLSEQGNGFNRSARRESELQADGSVRVTTSVMTRFTNGDVLEIFDDRHGNSQGNGTGNGTYSWTHADGSHSEGDLRTMIGVDGSLTSYLDSDDGDLMLREDARGQARLALRDSDGWDDSWTQVDFNAMLNSMTRIASND